MKVETRPTISACFIKLNSGCCVCQTANIPYALYNCIVPEGLALYSICVLCGIYKTQSTLYDEWNTWIQLQNDP